MKKVLFAALATLTLVQSAAFSNSYCDPCDTCYDDCQSFGKFYAYGDWLFWKFRRSDLDYGLTVTQLTPTSGPFITVNPAYESGWRIGGGYETCGGLDFQVRYTNYHNHAYDRYQTGSPIFPTRPSPAAYELLDTPTLYADADYNVDYQIVDIELGSITKDCGESRVRAFLGAKLAYIDQTLNSGYIFNPEEFPFVNLFTRERVNLDAYGLSAGFDFHRDLGYCLGVYTRGALAFLVGNYDLSHIDERILSETDAPLVAVDVRESCTCFVGEMEIGAGLDYLVYRSNCGEVVFSLGYEFQLWYNTDDFLTLDSVLNPANLSRNHNGIGVDGLVLRLTAAY